MTDSIQDAFQAALDDRASQRRAEAARARDAAQVVADRKQLAYEWLAEQFNSLDSDGLATRVTTQPDKGFTTDELAALMREHDSKEPRA